MATRGPKKKKDILCQDRRLRLTIKMGREGERGSKGKSRKEKVFLPPPSPPFTQSGPTFFAMAARLAQLANTDSRFPILCIFLLPLLPAGGGRKNKGCEENKAGNMLCLFRRGLSLFAGSFLKKRENHVFLCASIYPYSQVRLNVGDEADGHEGAGTSKPNRNFSY